MRKYAPIVLFVYKRKEHVKQVIEALLQNEQAKESNLIVFSDGAKGIEDKAYVERVRDYIKQVQGFKNIQIVERTENLGLAESVIFGLNAIFQKYDKAIILEDDIIVNDSFLAYMNDALEKYESNKNVYSITGYSFFQAPKNEIPEYYFLRIGSSWSWATWADRWEKFDAQASGWKRLKWDIRMRYKFDYDGSYPFYSMLKEQLYKNINSWAIRWYWIIFISEGLTLFPKCSMVDNVGFDGSGEHCLDIQNRGYMHLIKQKYHPEQLTDRIVEERFIRKEIVSVFRAQNPSLCKKVLRKLFQG